MELFIQGISLSIIILLFVTLKGMLWNLMVFSLLKLIHYKYFRSGETSNFNLTYWIKDNWLDFVIQMGIAFIVFHYSHEMVQVANLTLYHLNIGWEVPHFEDATFYWLFTPFVTMVLSYKYARKKFQKKIFTE